MKKMLCVLLVLFSLLACCGAQAGVSCQTHKWKLTSTRKEPTCTEKGTGVYQGENCGERKTDSMPTMTTVEMKCGM